MKILITGGAGFIGSHLVRLFVKKYPNYHITNIDSLSYAGNLENIKDIESFPNYSFIKMDIRNHSEINSLFNQFKFDSVIHLAAESHVDRSITNPMEFVETNVIGTVNLLNAFKSVLDLTNTNKKFYQISTDEVYGSLGDHGLFSEESRYEPNSPYSASKASADHFVRSYGETYNIPYLISNCSNNYGEYQFPEKLIPLTILNIIKKKKIPVYGDGNYTRDWLYVQDHAKAIDLVFHKGVIGQTYNIGGFNEWKNIDLVKLICKLVDEKYYSNKFKSEKLITFVKDRPGHDKRYAIDASKINKDLGWTPNVSIQEGLSLTIDWYLKNQEWMKKIISGEYTNYYKKQYMK